jgi:hypothetical protein
MKVLKICLWTVGLSLVGILYYIAHENRERAIRGQYIESHLRLGMSASELEKALGHAIVFEPWSERDQAYYCTLEKNPGGIYRTGYSFLLQFDKEKKIRYYQGELTPVWGDTEITTSNLK